MTPYVLTIFVATLYDVHTFFYQLLDIEPTLFGLPS